MGELHDRAVEELYKTFDFLINDYDREVFWDEVYTELDYFEGQIDPRELPDRDMKGKQVGEMDVVLVKELDAPEENWMKYFEVKPVSGNTSYADDQIERAEGFFGPRGWNVLTEVYTVPEWRDNYYNRERDFSLQRALTDGGESPDTKYEANIDEDVDRYITDVERELRDELE